MDLLELQKQEKLVDFIRRTSSNWDFTCGQILELEGDDKLFLKAWCQKIVQILDGSLVGLDEKDRLVRLESEKEFLSLQLTAYLNQIETQSLRITQLEKVEEERKRQLDTTQTSLSNELINRSSLETQKLELLTEISCLKLKLVTLEKEIFELRENYSVRESETYEKLTKFFPPSSSPIFYNSQLTNGGESNFSLRPSRPRTPPANAFRRIEPTAFFGTLPRRNSNSVISEFNSPQNNKINKNSAQSFGNLTYNSNIISRGNSNLNPNNLVENSKISSKFSRSLSCRHPSSSSHQQLNEKIKMSNGSSNGTIFNAKNNGEISGGGIFRNEQFSNGIFNDKRSSRGAKSTSAPNLAEAEKDDSFWAISKNGEITSEFISSNGDYSVNQGKKLKNKSKSRGLLKLISRLRRTNSSTGGIYESEIRPENENNFKNFKRGGLRSTAGPRLGWPPQNNIKKPEGPMSSWDLESIIQWFSYIGLSNYSPELKKWGKNGQKLLQASSKELEKDIGLKNPIHRKKVELGVHYSKNVSEVDYGGKLDWCWVVRWLDDIGLPQYKDSFSSNRVDGRILYHLTTEDLIHLKVLSLLHHNSIKRAIQILRIHNFHPGCLCRRSVGLNNSKITPQHVATWTNHRVMEWLKSIHLAEYAPNLRGSGVHGSLIVFESKFNAELLATLLLIPSNKTLLRRHLSLQLNELVGRQIMEDKKIMESSPNYTPISPTLKVKQPKPVKFNLRKKRLSSELTNELLCPIDCNSFPFTTLEETEDFNERSVDESHENNRNANLSLSLSSNNDDKINNISY